MSYWDEVVPWAAPSLAFAVWAFVMTWLVGRWRRWALGRLDAARVVSKRVVVLTARITAVGAVTLGAFLWALAVPLSPSVLAWVRHDAEPWVLATVFFIAFLALGFYAIRKALVWLEARAARTEMSLDDALVEALGRPMYVALVLAGIRLWAAIVPIPAIVQTYIAKGTETTVIVLIVLFLDGLVQGWMVARSERSKVLKTSGVVLRATARIVFYIVGALMALSSIGFDVTPALATLGIGSAAVGFALQGTVVDFLAGIMIASDQPVSVGDFVKIDENFQGWVLVIGWRTTRILTRNDTHIVVPNSKLAQAMFFNMSRPREDYRFQVAFMLSYATDLDRAVHIAAEVGEVIQTEEPRAAPGHRATAGVEFFLHGHAEVRTWLWAKSYDAHFGLKDAYLRRLHARLREVGIVIPNPIRTLEALPGTTFAVAREAKS